jgi:hypothetical protein
MRLIVSALAVLTLAACHRDLTAPAGERFLVTAFATPQSLRAGEATAVIVGITNLTSQPQTFDANFCGAAYQVFNPAGVRLYPSGACSAVYIMKTLQPGEQVVYASEWTTTQTAAGASPPLAPGTYTLRGALTGADVHSDSVTVQLTP